MICAWAHPAGCKTAHPVDCGEGIVPGDTEQSPPKDELKAGAQLSLFQDNTVCTFEHKHIKERKQTLYSLRHSQAPGP